MASEIAKAIILDELDEQSHPEAVEDVIFWALRYYAENHKTNWGGAIANSLCTRIEEEETKEGGLSITN